MAFGYRGRYPYFGIRNGFSGPGIPIFALPGPVRFWQAGLFVLYGAGTCDFPDPILRNPALWGDRQFDREEPIENEMTYESTPDYYLKVRPEQSFRGTSFTS